MHQLVVFLLLFIFLFLLPDAAFSAPAGGSSCNRRCGSTTVPYPFGFSSSGGGGAAGCPILLACNATTSTPLLPRSTAGEPYPVLSFNATASTFLVSLAPSCGRAVADARAALDNAAGYGVSSRTGLFLRGGCRTESSSPNASSSCNVPSGVMSAILRTAQCGGGNAANDTSWTCVLSAPGSPGAAGSGGEGQFFLRWDEVAAAGCQDALTSAVYAYTAEGVASIEFGIAEMGWWLNGSCGNGGGEGGQCAVNATCQDVQTPGGAWGHRCECADGMAGDGFAAGDGCRYDGATSGECTQCGCCFRY